MRSIVNRIVRFISVFVLLAGSSLASAEVQLYETGPSEESSFVRFVNATENEVAIGTGKGKEKILGTRADGRVTRFFKIKAGSKLAASLQSKGSKVAVEVVGKPWEFITVAVMPDGVSKIKTMLLKETPTEFSGTRASLALFNLDAKCGRAVMPLLDKGVTTNFDVQPFVLQRHLIGSDKQAAAISCSGASSVTAVDLSQLEQGERYSVFLLALKNVRQTFIINDGKK